MIPTRPLPASAALAILVLAGLVGCAPAPVPTASPSPAVPRVVTAEEAERLAVMRFRNYDAGTRSIEAAYDDAGHRVRLTGVYDYAAPAGSGVVSTDGVPTDTIVWDAAAVAISPDPPAETAAPTPPASIEGWTVGGLDASRSDLETVLAVVAALGADRPENPLLLVRSGALWLREDAVAGTPVTVFAGPAVAGSGGATASADPDAAGLRYWVDGTGLARRVEIRLRDAWATVDLGDGGGATVPPLPAGAGRG